MMDEIYFLIPNWKWLTLFSIVLLVFLLRPLFESVLGKMKAVFFRPQPGHFSERFLAENVERDMSWIIVLTLCLVAVENLHLTDNLNKYFFILLKLGLALNIIRLVYKATHAVGALLEAWAAKTESTVDDQLVPLLQRTLKVLVVIIGVLVVLENFGVNVTALIAGLGIGGIAIAFAAQDTVANVFGTITILLDAPFKIGDRIRVADTEGVVHEVGFRSTRIRTLYNSIVTVPNATMAKEKVDNLTERNNILRFRVILGFTYNSPMDQLKQFCDMYRYQLSLDPRVDKSRITVTFHELAESSLNILANFHYKIDSTEDEAQVQQDYLYMIHKLAQEHKLDFAFPTRTLVFEQPLVEKKYETKSISLPG